MSVASKLPPKPQILDYINLAIKDNYLIYILVTSSAQAKVKSLGLDYGMGKSTRMMWMLNTIYAGNWEKVKPNMVARPVQIKKILDRGFTTMAWGWDDMQATVGKDKQHDPKVRELAYYMTTLRPYYNVMIGTAPHRGMLQKDFRDLFHFEVITPVRGRYEVQQLKRWIDYKKPTRTKDRLRYKGEGFSMALPQHMEVWYQEWRHRQNQLIRKNIALLRELDVEIGLDWSALSEIQKVLLKRVRKNAFMRYETVQRKGLIREMKPLQKAGWLTLDRNRRYELSILAEAFFDARAKQKPSTVALTTTVS